MTLLHTSISNWSYLNTLKNPADFSPRPALPEVLFKSFWFMGPSFLGNSNFFPILYDVSSVHDLLLEERPSVKDTVAPSSGLSLLFERV